MAQRVNRQPQIIDATILFIDLMSSVALSTSLSLYEYNDLINEYQDTLRGVIDDLRQSYPVGEYYLGGDQLAVFFYDPQDAQLRAKVEQLRRRNPLSPRAAAIEAELELRKNRCLYGALRCGVQVKNAWTAHRRNFARVESQQPVLDVGVGINTGHVILQPRGDGRTRIEGFAINFAKRVEGFARYGSFCKIMLSKTAYETFRNIVIRHAMLKQRAFFNAFEPQAGLLKGLAPGTKVYELKFFHRLAGFDIGEQQVDLYRRIFALDATNFWAYSNLLNYYLYTRVDLEQAQAVAHRALYSNPESEKIYYDLGHVNLDLGDYDAAAEYCQRCVRLNEEMDIAFDMLGDIEARRGDWDSVLRYRSKALALSPGCAAYQLQVAQALAKLGRLAESRKHACRALQLYPQVADMLPEETRTELEQLLGQQLIGAMALKPCKPKRRRKGAQVSS